MLKRIVLLFLSVCLPASAPAQDAAPAEAAPPLMSRAVMTSEQVIRILDETVDWYRMLGVQQQSATQPSDLLILYANRQAADRVVALAFELARANAELLSSQAEMDQQDAPSDPEAPTSPQALQRSQRDLDGRRTRVQGEIAAAQRQLAAAEPEERTALQARLAELQSELDLVNARRNLLNNMMEFAHETDANGSGVSALKEHINAIAASIPAATGVVPELGAVEAGAAAPGVAAAQPPAEQVGARRFGIWDLGANVLRLQSKLATINDVDRRTEELQQTFTQIRALPEQQIKALSARGDELGARPAGSDAAVLKAARDEYDTIAWLFAQTSSILVPLTKAGVLLDQYRNNLASWRDATRAQYRSALKTLAARGALLLVLLGAVFAVGEVWKRAVFGYVQEARRRHQLLLVRRIVMWAVALAIIGIAFATEASSFATFAGLLTAGIAVAMQSVLVSIVGYFFLIGKYGLRVGDRVQIGTVTGEVIDLGLVRLHLMELGPQFGPTGRVVALANSVVFQASGGIFKQIPGVSLAWREVSLKLPANADYTVTKERLLRAADGVLADYRVELERQTRELQKASSWNTAEETQAQVQLRFSSGSVDATVRYPVPLQRAAEVEERMSRALFDAVSDSVPPPPGLAAQPA
jgi:small-conductance mechanosensitive channel